MRNLRPWLISLSIIALVIGIVEGYYSRQNQTATSPPSSGRSTYTEPQYGFSFLYESGQKVTRQVNSSIYGGQEVVLSTNFGNSISDNFGWFIEENTRKTSLFNFSMDNTKKGIVSFVGKKPVGALDGDWAEFPQYFPFTLQEGSMVIPAHLEYYFGCKNMLCKLRLYVEEKTISDSSRQRFTSIIESIKIE